MSHSSIPLRKNNCKCVAGYCCRYCRKPAAGTPQRANSAETRLLLHGRVHPPGAIINTQGTVSAAKTQMKANCSWKNQQCCSISKPATSDPALPFRDLLHLYPKPAPLEPWAILFPSMWKATFCKPQWKPDPHKDRGVVKKQLLRGRWLSDWLPSKIALASAAKPAKIQAVTCQPS